MTCNVGGWDRKLRVVAGLLLLAAGAYFKSWWGVVGLVPLTTAAMGWCPLYIPLGLSTKK
jgi:hypothetical protein